MAGLDDRPPEAQAGGAGHHDARELEHAVRGHQRDEVRAVARARGQATDHAEQHAVEEQDERRSSDRTTIPPAKARKVTRMLLVSTWLEKAASSAGVRPRSVPFGPGSAAERISAGASPEAAPGSATAHSEAGSGRAEEQEGRHEQRDRALAHPTPVAAGEEPADRPATWLGVVDEAARPAHEVLEAGEHRVTPEPPSRQRQVGRCRAVEGAEAPHAVGTEALRSAPSLAHERLELAPAPGTVPRGSARGSRCLGRIGRDLRSSPVEYEDVITVPTPEGVELELTLAGVGSRFASAIVDVLLEGVILLGLLAALSQVLSLSGLGEQSSTAIIAAVGSLAAFLVIFGYHVLFETLASGRTPGKRLMGLRVARVGGNPVRFRESAVRNLVRLVDIVPPPLYGVGAVAILAGRRNQRLGDVAAGTLVVRERQRGGDGGGTSARAVERRREMRELRDRVLGEVGKVVVGQEDAVELMLAAAAARGHVLLEGVPGVAKTLLANAMSRALGLPFRRLQFTPDMLPSDVTGTMTLRQGELAFRPGPIFTSVLLADEVNRTPPKTQAALLEAMQEAQVTVEGESRALPDPFLVVATQNPVEYEGTYPLPEAQLDRFMVKVDVGYPSEEHELAMLRLAVRGVSPATLELVQGVADAEGMRGAREALDRTEVTDEVAVYVATVVRETRSVPSVSLGASPRAAVHLLVAAKAAAQMAGRTYVTPDDVVRMARPVLRHRLLLRPEAELERYTPDDAVEAALGAVPVPR
ncbi:MAG: AAA family ATPase [Thermoleophilaceae bacterium]